MVSGQAHRELPFCLTRQEQDRIDSHDLRKESKA